MTEPKPNDRAFYEKNRNPITGDRLVTKAPTEQYKENFDKIRWSDDKEKESNE